ncbi:MAG: hypothetical protein OER88_13455, partial [Planctomycetota bacterium]|nr:hypothetical protein [Planctomycetota bacterium]
RVDAGGVRLTARVARWDGREVLEAAGEAGAEQALSMAAAIAEELKDRGAADVLAEAREHVDARPPL